MGPEAELPFAVAAESTGCVGPAILAEQAVIDMAKKRLVLAIKKDEWDMSAPSCARATEARGMNIRPRPNELQIALA